MRKYLNQRIVTSMPRLLIGLFVLVLLTSRGFAAETIRLKNGASIRGKKLVMSSLTARPRGLADLNQVKDADPDPPVIGRVENDWQVVYYPLSQQENLDPKKIALLAGPEPVTFMLKSPPKKYGSDKLGILGSMTHIEPFNDFGQRRVTIQTPNKPLDVFQAISGVSPDHVVVESTNIEWKLGLPLKTIPIDTLEKVLRRHIRDNDANDRFALALFYTQAEFYEHAFKELDAIARDFPDKTNLVDKRRADYLNYFGKEILLRLERRKRAGQHQLAESYAKLLTKQPLGSMVQQDVQKYLETYEESRQSIEKAKHALADWQAKINDAEHEKLLQPMRSEVSEQLDFDTLPRLTTFLKAELDNDYDPSQRLALAYSGWILGAANAIPDLDQAFRIWNARNTVLEYLRSDDPSQQSQLLRQLQTTENYSPEAVEQIIAQLPPLLDASEIVPGVPHQVETPGTTPARYWVTLPAEYSPHHSYPTLLALRSRANSTEVTLRIWAGDGRHPDLGHQRGYIVIAPEYADPDQAEYSFGAPAHKRVLDCLIDARKRFSVDSNRVYLAGNGMGADAAFDIGFSHPDEFAGVLPMGGNAINYCNFCWENGSHTAWYVVGKGLIGGTRDAKSNAVFNNMMKRGFKFDFMLVEYLGRNGEDLYDEIPKAFDWMELAAHVRSSLPKKFDMHSLRQADNRFFWVTANGLPRDYILPSPVGDSPKIKSMDVDAKVLASNIIQLRAPTDNFTIRLLADLGVDFDRKLEIKVGGRRKFYDFIQRDAGAMLDELRMRGDRTRLPLAVLNPGSH